MSPFKNNNNQKTSTTTRRSSLGGKALTIDISAIDNAIPSTEDKEPAAKPMGFVRRTLMRMKSYKDLIGDGVRSSFSATSTDSSMSSPRGSSFSFFRKSNDIVEVDKLEGNEVGSDEIEEMRKSKDEDHNASMDSDDEEEEEESSLEDKDIWDVKSDNGRPGMGKKQISQCGTFQGDIDVICSDDKKLTKQLSWVA